MSEKNMQAYEFTQLVDEPSAEDVLVEEHAYNDEEANLQRALELSLKEQAERTHGPTRPVVIREPDSGRFQPLPEVQGKGKKDELKQHMANLLQYNLALEERLDKHGFWLYKLENLNIPYKNSFGLPLPQPPPLPPPAGTSGALAGISGTQELSLIDSLIQDDSIPNEQIHSSNDEDSENDRLPKADSRKDWWKPPHEEERPTTPEPAWTIPSSNVSDTENNWATALASTYVTPVKNSLLAKTGDMMNFLNCYYRQVNKTKRTQAYLEGQAYEVVKAFYPDVINLQFQMEEYMNLHRVEKKSDHTCGFLVSSELKPTQDTGSTGLQSQRIQDQAAQSGYETHFWTQKNVTRSKEFIVAIERRLKTSNIYWNLECFVGGRVRDIYYRLL
uniref:Uncharacterized protein n=1 Tax=Tanacetum cinerariifolium TaxID=118510 RepID=A0A699I5M3_TANCI|nr:hypothetical protein [Tanacetum cinerariifolium]